MTKAMAMRAASAFAVASAMISPVAAQLSDMDRAVGRQESIIGQKEEELREMEAAQARGDCAAYARLREELLTEGVGPLVQQPSFNPSPGASIRDIEISTERSRLESDIGRGPADNLRRRFEQIDARGCPPQGVSPAQPPAVTTAPQPPVQPEPAEDIQSEVTEGRDLLRETGDAELAPATAPRAPGTPVNPPPPPGPGYTPLELLNAEADVANRAHEQAAARCDRAAMQAQIAELERIQREARQLVDTAAAAGGSAAVTPAFTNQIMESIGRALQEALQRAAETCPDPDRRVGTYTPRFAGFRFGVSYERFDDAQTGTGFQRDGQVNEAPETFAGLTPSRIDVTGVELGGDFGRLEVSLGYGWGSGDNDFRISDHLDSGIVYGELSPNGDSGIAAPFGLSGRTELDLRWYSFDAQYSLVGPTADEVKAKMLGFGTGPYVFVRRFRREYDFFAEGNGTFNNFDFHFEQTREQRLIDDQIGGGIFIESGVNVTRALSAHLTGRAGLYHYSTRLDSFERNMNNFTGPPDDDFTLEFDEEERGIGYELEAGFRLDYMIGRSASIYVGTHIGYRSHIGQIRNLFSGDQSFVDGMTTGLGGDHSWGYGSEAGIRVRF